MMFRVIFLGVGCVGRPVNDPTLSTLCRGGLSPSGNPTGRDQFFLSYKLYVSCTSSTLPRWGKAQANIKSVSPPYPCATIAAKQQRAP